MDHQPPGSHTGQVANATRIAQLQERQAVQWRCAVIACGPRWDTTIRWSANPAGRKRDRRNFFAATRWAKKTYTKF